MGRSCKKAGRSCKKTCQSCKNLTRSYKNPTPNRKDPTIKLNPLPNKMEKGSFRVENIFGQSRKNKHQIQEYIGIQLKDNDISDQLHLRDNEIKEQ